MSGKNYERTSKRDYVALRSVFFVVCAIAVATFFQPSRSVAHEIGLSLFGASYHYESRTYTERGRAKQYDQTNPGLGIQFIALDRNRTILFADIGSFKDSKANRTSFLSMGYKYKVTSFFRVGVGLTFFDSDTFGIPVAPLPVATFRIWQVGLNTAWLPLISNDESGSLAFWGTVYFW